MNDVPAKASSTSQSETQPSPAEPRSAAAPFPAFASLREEMERAFDDILSGFPLMPFGRRAMEVEPRRRLPGVFGGQLPTVDVVERDGEYCITAELPGSEEKDIDVSLAEGILTVKGEKKQEREEKKDSYYVSERRYGSFQRSFRVPDDADADGIAATFKNGVLTLTLPKKPEAKRAEKKIAVKAA
ncbi:HSP20 family protein [Constrictibacter sp. MBR-5]|uniref:Hsp20/alpha crystallin family protein n=1 Tax=Constrictibacter sp. MBR-5 TaxID=3156467 RepID=UPI003397FA3D